jgi:hypothetical protein
MEQQGSDGGANFGGEQNSRKHIIRANWVWNLPGVHGGDSIGYKTLRTIVNDWQVSGVYSAMSGARYSIGYLYLSNGSNVNITGSPDYAGRVLITGDPGVGCSSDQYKQFNTSAFSGPTYGSVGMESGRNYMTGCWTSIWDLAFAKNVRLGKGMQFQLRAELYNLFNSTFYTARNTTVQLMSPTNQTVANSQYLPNGTLDPNRIKPSNAGFGAVTGTNNPRTMQLQLRFTF